MTETDEVSTKQIEVLRSEAGAAGDYEMVADCSRALSGDADAWAFCERVIADARALARENTEL